ncbi:MAG TPA: peptide-methionine (S)-S-oxide reductase MsrA [Rhizomicrobium sp.]|jgi:peptide-methionine (S)-S-oxide reductase|nr:peptide-methionine (S)-S-oxide reductase MsrA [Rhizomicrobium sp.]
MMRSKNLFALGVSLIALGALPACADQAPRALPAAMVDESHATAQSETAVLAGGCFWGLQGVFEHVKGVSRVVSGYSGGDKATAHYETVSEGNTGHAESVQITFDPRQVTFGELLRVYFSVATDPTELNRQGPDSGTNYRSDIFFTSPEQQKIADAYIAQLGKAHAFGEPIVTRVDKLTGFYPAEAYHQDYLIHNPDSGYIQINDLPKIANLKRIYPAMYRDKPVMVAAK